MNKKIRDYVATRTEPSFFCKPNDEELALIHTEVQHSIETATDVMTFEIDLDVMLQAQAFLATIGWTLEEACVLFLYWFVECPKEAVAWDKTHRCRTSIFSATGKAKTGKLRLMKAKRRSSAEYTACS